MTPGTRVRTPLGLDGVVTGIALDGRANVYYDERPPQPKDSEIGRKTSAGAYEVSLPQTMLEVIR